MKEKETEVSRVEVLEREILALKAQMQKAEEERYMATLSVVKKVNGKKRASRTKAAVKRLDGIKKIKDKNDRDDMSIPSREGGK